MKFVSLRNNQFSGILHLTSLPQSLRRMDLSQNSKLNGEIDRNLFSPDLTIVKEGTGILS